MLLVEGWRYVGTALAEMTMPQISPLAGEPIERADAERLAGVLKALADPARLRLLSLIQSAPDGEACVCDLTAPLGLSQPTVSHHLRILTEAGLLEREKRGVWAYYRLVPAAIATIADLLTPPRKRATKKARCAESGCHRSRRDARRRLRRVRRRDPERLSPATCATSSRRSATTWSEPAWSCGSGGNLSARIPDEDACWVTGAGTWLDRLSRGHSFAPVRIVRRRARSRSALCRAAAGRAEQRGGSAPGAPIASGPTSTRSSTCIRRPRCCSTPSANASGCVTTDHAFYLRRVVTVPFRLPGTAELADACRGDGRATAPTAWC